MSTAQPCFHCQLTVPENTSWTVIIDGAPRPMCCPGCAAAAQAIIDLGLGEYYKHRTAAPDRPDPLDALREAELAVWDDQQLEDQWAPAQGNSRSALISIEGMRCPACGWLVERSLQALPGILQCTVNYQTAQATVRWLPEACSLGTLLKQIQRAGYRASPWRPDQESAKQQEQTRSALIGLGVAGIGMMQVMMYAAGLYIGDWQGLDADTGQLLRTGSLVMATLVLLFASRIFFQAAWRQLRAGRPGMDVPVAIAIGAAYAASLWHTWAGAGEIYFDSVCMFTFFLLLGRYLELRARQHATAASPGRQILPVHAWQIVDGTPAVVPAISLQPGTQILVRPGECCPADGRIIEGHGHLDESLLTGEATPVTRGPGDPVTAGSMNLDQPLQVQVEAAGLQTRAAAIERAVTQAASSKPDIEILADRIAAYFVPCVLILTAGVWIFWRVLDAQRAFDVALAVLVVTCPCALSLATPAALAAATRSLRSAGILITGARALDALADIDRVCFDKTGTLTEGRMQLQQIIPLADEDEQNCLRLAAALEVHDEHPVARAVLSAWGDAPLPVLTAVRHIPGAGIEATAGARQLRIGRPAFAAPESRIPEQPDTDALCVLLADQNGPLAWLVMADRLRPDAIACVRALQALDLHCEMLSGDSSARCSQYGLALGITAYSGDCTPEQKLEKLQSRAAQGSLVLMVGDGINDAPGLQAAAVSMAMGGGSDLSRARADAILLNDRLSSLPVMLQHARRTRRIVRQNLYWALLYNICAVPAAACGLIPPWLSALGMSASSLLVTLNALRLTKLPGTEKE